MWIILVLIALGVALVQWRAGAREVRANAEYPPQGKILDIDGVPVHALVLGSGPDLVYLHGASGNTRDVAFGIAQDLAKSYRVIIFDRPGLGHTGHTRPEYASVWRRAAESPMEQAQLLQKAALQLGADTPLVVGHSFGGAVAWAWALSAPEQTAAVVSIAGVANPWPGKLSLQHRATSSVLGAALLVPVLSAFAPQSVVERTLANIYAPQSPPDGYLEAVGVGLVLRRASMRANARQITSLRPHVVAMSQRYGELAMPVEIVHGDADTIVPLHVHSASLPDQIEGAQLTVLTGVGHMPHHTHRTNVLAVIDRAASRAGLR